MTGKCHACGGRVRLPYQYEEGDRAWSWVKFEPITEIVEGFSEKTGEILWKPMHWCCIPLWEAEFGMRDKQDGGAP